MHGSMRLRAGGGAAACLMTQNAPIDTNFESNSMKLSLQQPLVCRQAYVSVPALFSPASCRARLRSLRCCRCRSSSNSRSSRSSSGSVDGPPPPPPPPLPPPPTAITQRQRLRSILSFCLPVMLVPLADPIMSLIDTVCLGRMSDALQLAALGPSRCAACLPARCPLPSPGAAFPPARRA